MPDDLIGLLDDRLRAERLLLDHVPAVDLTPLRTGGDTAGMAAQIAHALGNIGFMYVTGHGVPREVTARAFSAAEAFFALPEEEKAALHITRTGAALHGYTEFFGETNDPGRSRDLKEIFDLGREASDGRTRPFFGPTPWPLQAVEPALEVHRLEQSRTIRPERFEYFDSEWLGLLLRVTPHEIDPVEEEADDGDEAPEEAASP